jgi:hypothetical protein
LLAVHKTATNLRNANASRAINVTATILALAASRFHHPVHAAEWVDPAIDAAYNDVWQLLMDGLCVVKSPG